MINKIVNVIKTLSIIIYVNTTYLDILSPPNKFYSCSNYIKLSFNRDPSWNPKDTMYKAGHYLTESVTEDDILYQLIKNSSSFLSLIQ